MVKLLRFSDTVRRFIPLVTLVLGLGLGWAITTYVYVRQPKSVTRTETRQKGFRLTSPLLECDVENQFASQELVPFRSAIERVINDILKNKEATHISLYFRDLSNGPWIGINEDEEFTPSSLLKVPLMMAYYKRAQEDPDTMAKEFRYEGGLLNPEESQTPVTLKEGKSYTVGDLINRMIIFSDNAAAHLLYDNIDPKLFAEPYKALALEPPYDQIGNFRIPVRKYSGFFRLLYNSSFLNPEVSERALDLLTKTQFPYGLEAGVPKELSIAHKYGERSYDDGRENQLHDCGIIYYPNYPYVLCVMTKGSDIQKLARIITLLSKTVYTEVNTQRNR